MKGAKGNVRPPAVAGQFYDINPSSLRSEIESYLENAEKRGAVIPEGARILAVVAPHAGYVYSGQTAADVFRLCAGAEYSRAIVLAPSHRYAMDGLAYADYSAYSTPLGEIQMDTDAMKSIAGSSKYIFPKTAAHSEEHALEVELPFLQVVQPWLPIVPFICGQIGDEAADSLSDALLEHFIPENLWVLSSDFTHYGHSFGYVPFSGGDMAEKLRKLDSGAAGRIEAIDYRGFSDYVEKTGATICGANPIKVLLRTAEKAVAGGRKIRAKLVSYTTSGETTGDYSHCVSYAGIAVYE